jgi:hypothetical protein
VAVHVLFKGMKRATCCRAAPSSVLVLLDRDPPALSALTDRQLGKAHDSSHHMPHP